ncbi:MAG TPA: FxsA family protein [Polyangiales bacterium]|nr:FxsA family protein [Polyangiales bacterium]
MLGKLFLLFTIVPALELYVLIQIGDRIGGLATLAMLFTTGILGAVLARAEGLRVVRTWQSSLAAGTVPPDGVISGALVLLGGLLLITPGVLSDIAGLLLLVPAIRRPVARYVAHRLERAVAAGTIKVVQTHTNTAPRDPFSTHRASAYPDVIDVEGEPVPNDPASRSRLP